MVARLLDDKIAIVTGAAHGIGRGHAGKRTARQAPIRAGHRGVAADRNAGREVSQSSTVTSGASAANILIR
jgi:NAD(P)-dependent dehydrogenase (short-subunit alcohol dehydrogenase family)